MWGVFISIVKFVENQINCVSILLSLLSRYCIVLVDKLWKICGAEKKKLWAITVVVWMEWRIVILTIHISTRDSKPMAWYCVRFFGFIIFSLLVYTTVSHYRFHFDNTRIYQFRVKWIPKQMKCDACVICLAIIWHAMLCKSKY